MILGAGLAGLACAHYLNEPCILIERQRVPGGMARSFERSGFTFDCTGHWLHLRDPEIDPLVRELLAGNLLEVPRRSAIYSRGILTPYPFQAHTWGRPQAVVDACVSGFLRARRARATGTGRRCSNFDEYIRQELGDGIAEHFMIPYNTKLWTVPPSEMGYEWCGRFVPKPSVLEVVLGARRPEGAGHLLGYNQKLLYPRSGGIGVLARALAGLLRGDVTSECELSGIDLKAKRVCTKNGRGLRWRHLVSTLPLPALIDLIDAVPDVVRAARQQLRAIDVTYWDIGVVGANGPGDSHWTYFPDPDVPFYRAGSTTAVNPGAAPPGCRSYYVEVSHPQGSSCPSSDADILRGLRRVGWLREDDVPLVMQRTTLDGAYVLMDHAYGPARAACLAWLRTVGIRSIGRYGAWTYDSMEGAMVQGRDCAKELQG